MAADGAFSPEAARDELLAKGARARALAAAVKEGDSLGGRLERLAAFAEASRFLEGEALVDHLLALESVQSNFGFKPHWPSPEALAEGRAIAAWTKEARATWAAARGADLHGRLVRALGGVASLYARKKAERGVLDFLDLLLVARDALRDHAGVREWYRRRFRYLVIDEFQDTDPLQVEIARLLAGDRPGALVVVGDAKQSIYRFRRAEVRLFRELVRRAETSPGGAVLHLVQNFRSRPAILRFVNRVFAELIQASEEADQPAYEPIAPPRGLSDEPSVVALRFAAPPNASGEDLLDAEASGLAAFLAGVAREREAVRDPVTGAMRPSRAGDVLVLARRLTRVSALEEALEAASLRFTVEGGKSFFDRQEVHEALAVLRAIDDPSDRIALVAALRSSFFGVSDRDIVAYSLSGGPLWAGAIDEERPGGRALGPALRAPRRPAPAAAARERPRPPRAALRGDAHPRRPHRLAPGRGAGREPREGGGARARGRLARGAHAARLREPPRGPDRRTRARSRTSPRPAPATPTRCASSRSTGRRGSRPRSWRSSTRTTAATRRRAPCRCGARGGSRSASAAAASRPTGTRSCAGRRRRGARRRGGCSTWPARARATSS